VISIAARFYRRLIMPSMRAILLAVAVIMATCEAFSVNLNRSHRLPSLNAADFSSKATSRASWKPTFGGDGQHRITMADPDVAPEVDPTRRDPDEPGPEIPIRLPMVDFGGTKMDVNSRLLKDRIIMIGKQVDDNMANVVVAQLLYLANEDPKADITMYINSPGGSISSGMAIFDTMQFIPCDVSTVCFGMAASMGAFLLGAGTKGKRRSLPNARIMIHQPLGEGNSFCESSDQCLYF
jgi:Clp protease